MLEGATAWPEEIALRYRREGWWQDLGVFDVLRAPRGWKRCRRASSRECARMAASSKP